MTRRMKGIKQNKLISVRDIVTRYNISYQTLNHYTNFGLLPVVLRIKRLRFYDEALISKRIKKIKELSREGYPLELIRKKLIGI